MHTADYMNRHLYGHYATCLVMKGLTVLYIMYLFVLFLVLPPVLVPRQTADPPRERPPLLEHIRPDNTQFPTQEPTNSPFLPGKKKNNACMNVDVIFLTSRI